MFVGRVLISLYPNQRMRIVPLVDGYYGLVDGFGRVRMVSESVWDLYVPNPDVLESNCASIREDLTREFGHRRAVNGVYLRL